MLGPLVMTDSRGLEAWVYRKARRLGYITICDDGTIFETVTEGAAVTKLKAMGYHF